MAIARGAGTEILRSIHLDEVDSTTSTIIFGAQHHIYTVLNVICFALSLQAVNNWILVHLNGYDALAGATAQNIHIFQQNMQNNQTFVWNDKFSFNGHEPTDFTGPLSTAAHQDAIADQGGPVQKLLCSTQHASDNFIIHATYLDQNNA